MMRWILPILLACTLLLGCEKHIEQHKYRKALREGFAPEILAYHADRSIRPGATWRIYLSFRDLDCDMTYIVADLWQSGVGPYEPSYTPIKETACKEIKGYLSLTTPTDAGLLQDQFKLKIFLRDNRGHRSRPIHLTLNFDWRSSQTLPEKWQAAASNSLGFLQIDLASSQSFQRGGA